MIRKLFNVLRRRAEGGTLRARPLAADEVLVILSPGGPITDPDEAEQLGLTADARRMRHRR